MPVITIEAGNMSSDQKEALIKEFTKTASNILKIHEQAFVVFIKENSTDNIGTGGRVLTKVLAERT